MWVLVTYDVATATPPGQRRLRRERKRVKITASGCRNRFLSAGWGQRSG